MPLPTGMIDRPYTQQDPRGWLPWHPKKPLKRLPMWQSPEHISYPILSILRELVIKQPKVYADDI